MPAHPLDWDTCALREQLEPLLPGLSVEVLERTVSTNTAILERARVADIRPCLLVAEQQTGGRGRQGRAWRSAPGASLTFSLALPLHVADWSGLSLAVGVAVAEALNPSAGSAPRALNRPHIGLKWPNDLWLMAGAGTGRKLGGILIETVTAGACRLAVIGIGLNVQPMELSDAGSGFASLQELDPTATAPGVLRQVALPLLLALRQFERGGFGTFSARFDARDLLRGHPVRTTQPDVPEGIARGVSAQGALLVQTASGLKPVSSGEVSVRLNCQPGREVLVRAHEAPPIRPDVPVAPPPC